MFKHIKRLVTTISLIALCESVLVENPTTLSYHILKRLNKPEINIPIPKFTMPNYLNEKGKTINPIPVSLLKIKK